MNAISIRALQGVGDVDLEFAEESRIRVLFGANGVGKTKCLEAAYQTFLCLNREFLALLRGRGTTGKWLVMRESSIGDIQVIREPKNNNNIMGQAISTNVDPLIHDFPVVFLSARGRSSLGQSTAPQGMLGDFSTRKANHFNRILHDWQRGLFAPGADENIRSWFIQRAHSVNPYQKSSDNRKVELDAVLSMLNEIDSRIDGSTLEVDGAGRVLLSIDGQMRELGDLSSGFASLLKIAQSIVSGYAAFTNERSLTTVKGIVLIDEVESHLHVRWQTLILGHLKRVFPNTTFYIATHSPLVLAQLEDGEAYLLERDGEGIVSSARIPSPNRRAFADVLETVFNVDLNNLKRESLMHSDQSSAKRALLDLLKSGEI